MSWCKCPDCGLEFGSVKSFEIHIVGRYTIPVTHRCLTEKELLSKGFYQKPKIGAGRLRVPKVGVENSQENGR